jgi:hypothetical protein
MDTAALGVAVNHNVAEILREGPPEGLHIQEIGEKAGTSPEKLGKY